MEANPQYAHVRLNDGRETTVSICDLAPYTPSTPNSDNSDQESPPLQEDETIDIDQLSGAPAESTVMPRTSETYVIPPRRSARTSNPPSRLIEEM